MRHSRSPLPLPDVSVLREAFNYDPATGELRWRVDKLPIARAGDVAGTTSVQGYRCVGINGLRFRVSRIAWKMHHGTDPTDLIDHRDGNRQNDRISNLRDVTEAQNHMNLKVQKRNTSGVSGVTWCRLRQAWMARITCRGKVRALGKFDDKELAILIRKEAEEKYFGEFARYS